MEQSGFVFADTASYPRVRVKCMNQNYAKEMNSNLGACNSEMTAVNLCMYNSLIAKGTYEEISHCFNKIMMVELHHMEIFGELAFLLGADPRLWNYTRRRPVYWSPACSQYPREVKLVLQNAIKGERDAIAKYKRQAERIRDPYVVENLNRIILDEQCHIEVFQKLYNTYVKW